MIKFDYVTPGIFHSFDVCNILYELNLLSKLHTCSDLLRTLKWKKNLPLKKINYSKNPPIKFKKLRRESDYSRISNGIFNSKSDAVICYPNFALPFFQKSSSFKILDIDHFNWDSEVCAFLHHTEYKFQQLQINNPLDPGKFIMQKNKLQEEYGYYKQKFTISLEEQFVKAKEIEEADLLMYPTHFVGDALLNAGITKNKLYYNPYGFDPCIFYPKKSKKFHKTIVYFGTISIRKGWRILREILSAFNGTDLNFFIIGNVTDELRHEVDSLKSIIGNNIKFMGPKSQVEAANILRECNLAIFPSALEGFGMTILQALASGTPVISSIATCGSDLIKQHENGIVLDVRDVDAWINSIDELINNPHSLEIMARSAFKSTQNLNWFSYVKRLSSKVVELV